MGAFHLWQRRDDPQADAALRAASEEQLRRHGNTQLRPIEAGDYHGWHAEPVNGGPDCFHQSDEDWIAIAGTCVFDGKLGGEALARMLSEFRFPFADWDRVQGHFAALVWKGGELHVLTDWFGAFQLFHDAEFSLLSTSLLASCNHFEKLTFDHQAVYEHAFAEFALGDATPFAELRRLGPDLQLKRDKAGAWQSVSVEKPLPNAVEDVADATRVARHAEILRGLTKPFAEHFGDEMDCPLSAGFDSRLALAMLRDAKVAPHCYIYGKTGDADVDIPRRIAEAEGFHLEIENKQDYDNLSPEEFPAIVERNFHECDALVTDGGLFDGGGNGAARLRRQRGGRLTVSGGCGEIFRNFFYLPNRPYSPRDIASAFYAGFDPRDTTGHFDPDGYLGEVAAKANASLGDGGNVSDERSRAQIAQLYPRFRCRSFFGREISLVGRHGAYFMPFLEPSIAAEGLRLPLDLKNNGRFEARLIAHLDPALAAHPSSYGYAFTEQPNRAAWWGEFSTRIRPVALRRRTYQLRRMLGRTRHDHFGGLLGDDWLGRVMDLEFPHMRRFFNIGNIADPALYRRVATLEYLCQHLGSKISAH